MTTRFYLTGAVCLFIMLMLFAGCASNQNKPAAKSASAAEFQLNITNPLELEWPRGLRKEFVRYWTLRYTDAFEAAYAMEAPEFRKKVGFDQYKLYVGRTSSQDLLEIQLTKMDESETFSGDTMIDVGCRFHLKRKKGETVKSYVEDRWIQIEGVWFHALRNALLFPDVKYE